MEGRNRTRRERCLGRHSPRRIGGRLAQTVHFHQYRRRVSVPVPQPGFATLKVNSLNVALRKVTSVHAKLVVGQVSDGVSVSAEALPSDTATNSIAMAVTADVYDRLPKRRHFDSLSLMQPGVRNDARSGGFQANGNSASGNSFNIDGVEVTNQQNGPLRTQNQIPIK